uniref:Uncharacterized protein n=1 Tax=Romanomermis culicivorax TaxID=13658 RepID=A0A915IKV3_ROMCU
MQSTQPLPNVRETFVPFGSVGVILGAENAILSRHFAPSPVYYFHLSRTRKQWRCSMNPSKMDI